MTAPVRAASVDPAVDALTAVSAPAAGSTNAHAVSAVQAATAGRGSALYAETTNAGTPALVVRGPGPLLDFQDQQGRSIAQVGQSGFGALTAGAVTATTIGGTGDLTVNAGNLVVNTAGKGLRVKEGANARMGVATLNGATPVVVATTAVTAVSRIFTDVQDPNGGTPAFHYIASRVAATSFTLQGVALDTSIVAWLIVEPA